MKKFILAMALIITISKLVGGCTNTSEKKPIVKSTTLDLVKRINDLNDKISKIQQTMDSLHNLKNAGVFSIEKLSYSDLGDEIEIISSPNALNSTNNEKP